MAERPMKMPPKKNTEDETPEIVSQRVKPERGRYLLQVDRQTKVSFKTWKPLNQPACELKQVSPSFR